MLTSPANVRRHRFLGLAVVVLAMLPVGGCNIGCWFMPCSVSTIVVTTVRDPSGAPLPGVRVDVEAPSGETDAGGCVVVDGHAARPHDLFLRATKDGYKDYEGSRPWNAYRVDITLEPQSSAGASTATWQVPSSGNVPLECP
jgi:hypothetical protein